MSEIETKSSSKANVHASLSDLLLVRDGEPCDYLEHIQSCEFCQARLEEVCCAANDLQQAMMFEAELPVPDKAWAGIEQQLRARGVSNVNSVEETQNELEHAPQALVNTLPKASVWSSINAAIYSLAAAVVFTGMVSLYNNQGQQQAWVESRALQASIQSLMDNSRGLESVLQEVAMQKRTLALADESAIERLKWRLMLVDQRINESEASDEMSYEQVKSLWGERVDALTQLNKLYYANQVAVNNGEF